MSACRENPGEFSLGKQFIESHTGLNLIDTFSVKLSTVILDTVQTSGTGNVLLGSYHDDIFGTITSNSYFQVGVLENYDVEQSDTYDSLLLVIKYNGYYFGDTTKSQRISVHQLTENINYDYDDVITRQTAFHYNANPIGSIVYTPEPTSSTDTLTIKISDDIGLDLFAKLKDYSDIITYNETFTNYFHGLALIADDAYEGSIIGFNATEQDVRLVLFATRKALTSEETEVEVEFNLNDSTKQFNSIVYDPSSTQLKTMSEQRNKLPSTASGGLSFLQGGIGLAIRVDFPSLQEALLFERSVIVVGQLCIAPLRNSYDKSDLPSDLVLYEVDGLNRKTAQVFTNQGSVASSTLVVDELYHEETTYSFDVTRYLNEELANSYVDPEKGLLIMLPATAEATRFYRFVADAKNRNTKLKIYYLSY